jgi:rare lipoprotein A (peptidoglycan hydrolase)
MEGEMMLNSFIRRNQWTAIIFSSCVLIILSILVNGCSSMQNVVMKDVEKIQFGVASYYGKEFQGNKTSCGEAYDMNQLTAAHRALPFGTLVKVTNTKNGRSTVVKINDRGPHNARRVIDLSYAAADELGMVADGIVRVRLDVIDESSGVTLETLEEQEFQVSLKLDDDIYNKNQLPKIQLYFPLKSPLKNANLSSNEPVSLRNKKININLSQQLALNGGF